MSNSSKQTRRTVVYGAVLTASLILYKTIYKMNNNENKANHGKKPVYLYIAGDRSNVGKSSICGAIIESLINKKILNSSEIGYIKPATQCISATNVARYCLSNNIDCNPIGPIVYKKGYTSQVIDGNHGSKQDRMNLIKTEIEKIGLNKKLVIIDGVGYVSVGSVTQIDNVDVAKLMNAYTILIVRSGIGDAIDTTNLLTSYYKAKDINYYNNKFLGVIYNFKEKNKSHSIENCKNYVSKYFNSNESCLKLLGWIPPLIKDDNVKIPREIIGCMRNNKPDKIDWKSWPKLHESEAKWLSQFAIISFSMVAAFSSQDITLNSTLRIIHLIQTILIVLPICVYSLYNLYRNWHEYYMQKRGSTLILWIFGFGTFAPVIEYPYYSIVKLIDPDINYYHSAHEWVMVLSLLPRLALIALLTLRVYLLYFDHELSHTMSTEKWQMLINPSFLKDNYFVKNRNTFGSHKYMLKYVVLPAILLVFILFIICHMSLRQFGDGSLENFLALSFTLIWMIINIAIAVKYWKKYPSFNDNLYIRDELKIIIKLFASVPICIFIVSMMAIFSFYDEEASIILLYALASSQTALYWMLAIYPKRKCKKGKTFGRETSSSPSIWKNWQRIVSDINGYESFCSFLEKEFSIENILFITEYTQIKSKLKLYHEDIQKIIEEEDLDYTLELPLDLQTGLIAKDYEENRLFLECVNSLFCKYINPSTANMEINLSFQVRTQIIMAFLLVQTHEISFEEMQNIMKLLESAALEISYLMNDSFLRFRRTELFQELMEYFSNISTPSTETLESTP